MPTPQKQNSQNASFSEFSEAKSGEILGAPVISLHVLHHPNVLRVTHDGPCQP